MYRKILQEKYNYIIRDMFLVGIHPELHNTYKKISVPILNIV